jgi:large subunit ribosomal protein L30
VTASKKPDASTGSAAGKSKASGKTLTLVQIRSGICTPKDQKATLKSLGFRRMGQKVVRPDHPAIRGMVLKVRHLVEIVEG